MAISLAQLNTLALCVSRFKHAQKDQRKLVPKGEEYEQRVKGIKQRD